MVEKPKWLKDLLTSLNWQIFAWTINVGDPVEDAIDWILTHINNLITWAEATANWLGELREELLALLESLRVTIWDEILNIVDTVGQWWTDLAEWWETKKPIIDDWIDIALTPLRLLIGGVETVVNTLSIAWDNFFTVTLPTLASHFDITQALKDFRKEWKDLLNLWAEKNPLIVAFFTDPVEWLYLVIDLIVDRFWEDKPE